MNALPPGTPLAPPRRRPVAGVAVVVLCIGGGILWTVSGSAPPVVYETVPVQRRDLELALTASGRILPRAHVDVGAQVSGRLERLHVAIADRIEAGQLLAEIDAEVQVAPMSGTITALDAREGQTLNANYDTPVLMRIADLSTMTVRAEVSEANVVHLHQGMPVWFTTLGLPDLKYHAGLRQILPAPPEPRMARRRSRRARSSTTSRCSTWPTPTAS